MSFLAKRLVRLFSKSPSEFIALSNSTLESLSTKLDSIEEASNIDYSLKDGVLTISTPTNKVVINRQVSSGSIEVPNEQIWYSSVRSGPQRFNYVNGEWVNSKGVRL